MSPERGAIQENNLQSHPIDSPQQNGLKEIIGKIAPNSPSLIKVMNINEQKFFNGKNCEGMNFADELTSLFTDFDAPIGDNGT